MNYSYKPDGVCSVKMEFNIENRVDAILEMKIKDQPVIEKEKEN